MRSMNFPGFVAGILGEVRTRGAARASYLQRQSNPLYHIASRMSIIRFWHALTLGGERYGRRETPVVYESDTRIRLFHCLSCHVLCA